ncbi:serine hydrolase domain-containing protein [Krasilnikoviella flava]|uniref:D-alanyl-D-alanine carboxypeptidase n=1 Tax=Krasilnikoviella flava TaxID=526729 RepID=A0A1T5K5B0_9MICO|nr:serine hydrolase domain-containing protein [Krasilnikoviella flava]SKC58725.1 D-alanyl-D-alanine carboxypeptidase [Krasilnikoviella flava]
MTIHDVATGELRDEHAGDERPALRRILREIVDSGFTGVQLRVNDRHGEWAWSDGLAQRGEPGRPSTDGHMRIGSNTKTFVSTVVLGLVAEGKIALDAPAGDYLPGIDLDPRITVRMLLQHTSGVFNFTGEFSADGTFEPGIPSTGKEWVDLRLKSYRPQELVQLAVSKPARFAPGTDWSYSNTNYVLARLLIESVTGRTLAEEMERLVLTPLGLTGTVVPSSPELPEPHAHASYRYDDDGQEVTVDVTRQDPSWISSGGDMISTTRDLHLFISGLVGGRLLPAPLLSEMLTLHPKVGYGLGLFVEETAHGPLVTHNGGIAGSAALMYSTPDGGTTLTAGLNYVDDAALSMGAAFQQGRQRLLDEVFGSGRA